VRLLTRKRRILRNQRGQTMVEYLLMMAIMMGALIVMIGKLKQSNFFFKRFTEPLVRHITYNYKYGDPRAQGWDEGNPKLHIQISEPAGATFRLFQPPEGN
jgi:Flp pilus assembly pilin Flp